MRSKAWFTAAAVCVILAVTAVAATAQGPQPRGPLAALGAGFTYQGQLKKNGLPVTAACSMTFSLWDAQSNGGQSGGNQTLNPVTVANGLFTVMLNSANQFGAGAFTGQDRWLQAAVQCPGDGSPVTLSRQQLTTAPYALFAATPWVTSGSDLSYNAGSVGIGTTSLSPGIKLEVNGSALLTPGGSGGVMQFGAPSGETGLTIKGPNRADVRFDGATLKLVAGAGTGAPAATSGIAINTSGNVGIGETSPAGKLVVRGDGSTAPLYVRNSTNDNALIVFEDRRVLIGALAASTTSHVCYSPIVSGYLFAGCSSATEYVPTFDDGRGYPETADLVSIVPASANPYDDHHAPFVVQKAMTPCDSNLLGFIVNPESGADGTKLNDHYMPLAIYGYFPAKVTVENGAIQRGDALTSSSKPGYAMKATGACKIIGYALEAADRDGAIQVFAHQGENAASEVASLRAQLDELKQQNDAMSARLAAIERSQAPAQSALLPRDMALWAALTVVGVVLARRWR